MPRSDETAARPPAGGTPELVRELVTLSRRFRANAQPLHPELSFVDYSLLSEMAERDGVSAGDLVGLYGTNKSTISRQVAALHRAGLVTREPAPGNSRVQLLRPSPRGRELLGLAETLMHREVDSRTADWTPEETAAFRRLLERYNAASSSLPEE